MLKIGATLDYSSRSLLQVDVYAIEERRFNPNMPALFQGNLLCKISEFGVLFQHRINPVS